MVEGVGYKPGAPGLDNAKEGIWWGENLAGARKSPVRLSEQKKLVYAPHTYGPGVYNQGYFKVGECVPDEDLEEGEEPTDNCFPRNMQEIWDRHFAKSVESTGQPIILGEMGGWYTGQVWAHPHICALSRVLPCPLSPSAPTVLHSVGPLASLACS